MPVINVRFRSRNKEYVIVSDRLDVVVREFAKALNEIVGEGGERKDRRDLIPP